MLSANVNRIRTVRHTEASSASEKNVAAAASASPSTHPCSSRPPGHAGMYENDRQRALACFFSPRLFAPKWKAGCFLKALKLGLSQC